MINKGRVVSHPGLILKDALEELELSQSEFAYRSGLSIKNVSTLVNGESNITFDVALKLSAFFGNSVEGWINLQTQYDLYQNLISREEEYKEDWKIATLFDKRFFKELLDIEIDSSNKIESINSLRKCLSVASLQNLKHQDMYAFYKTSINKDLNEKNVILRNAWITIAENKARSISCSSFNKEKILYNKKYLRSLTLLNPDKFYPLLTNFLKECGIKLVVLPYLSGSNISGVTKWIDSEHAIMVAVNDCGKDADRFWFTVFHEIGHAIKNHKRHMTISYNKDQIEDQEEKEANEFASTLLIDQDKYLDFVKEDSFSVSSIKRFAKEQNVADFIILGRLQKDNYLFWTSFQNMKIKYKILF